MTTVAAACPFVVRVLPCVIPRSKDTRLHPRRSLRHTAPPPHSSEFLFRTSLPTSLLQESRGKTGALHVGWWRGPTCLWRLSFLGSRGEDEVSLMGFLLGPGASPLCFLDWTTVAGRRGWGEQVRPRDTRHQGLVAGVR